MFTKATLYTTEYGFFNGDVQADIDSLHDLGAKTVCNAIDGNLRRLEIIYPEIEMKYNISGDCVDRMLRHLRDWREPYDFENGDSNRDYGAYTEYYRPDQDFTGDTTNENPHIIIRYAEKNTWDMEHDFRQVIKLIDAGQLEEAKAYAESCLYPEVKLIEEYGDLAE